MTRAQVVDWATEVADDLDFAAARSWIAEEPGRKAAGYLPVYAPREAGPARPPPVGPAGMKA